MAERFAFAEEEINLLVDKAVTRKLQEIHFIYAVNDFLVLGVEKTFKPDYQKLGSCRTSQLYLSEVIGRERSM